MHVMTEKEMTLIRSKIELARTFSEELGDALSRREFESMVNKLKARGWEWWHMSGVCPSHDYIDANMVMHECFCNLTGVEEIDAENEAQLELWNEAWAIAKAFEFSV